jgi:hypothetical protein
MNNKQLILTVIAVYGSAVLYLRYFNRGANVDPEVAQYFTEQGLALLLLFFLVYHLLEESRVPEGFYTDAEHATYPNYLFDGTATYPSRLNDPYNLDVHFMDHGRDWINRTAVRRSIFPKKKNGYGFEHETSRYRNPHRVKGPCSYEAQMTNPIRTCSISRPTERCSGLGQAIGDNDPVNDLPGYDSDDIQSRASLVGFEYNYTTDGNKDVITNTGERYVDPKSLTCTGPSNEPYKKKNGEKKDVNVVNAKAEAEANTIFDDRIDNSQSRFSLLY